MLVAGALAILVVLSLFLAMLDSPPSVFAKGAPAPGCRPSEALPPGNPTSQVTRTASGSGAAHDRCISRTMHDLRPPRRDLRACRQAKRLSGLPDTLAPEGQRECDVGRRSAGAAISDWQGSARIIGSTATVRPQTPSDSRQLRTAGGSDLRA